MTATPASSACGLCSSCCRTKFGEGLIILVDADIEAVVEMQSAAGSVSLPFGDHPFSATSEQIFSVKLVVNGIEIDAVVDLGQRLRVAARVTRLERSSAPSAVPT